MIIEYRKFSLEFTPEEIPLAGTGNRLVMGR